MQFSEIFRESPETDLARDREARALVSAFVRHFIRGSLDDNYGLSIPRGLVGMTAPALVITGSQMGFEGDAASILFMLGTRRKPAAYFSHTKSGRPYICLNLFNDLDDIEGIAKTIVHTYYLHTCLRHELVHYLDLTAHPGMDLNAANNNPDADTDRPGYYNSAHEVNAFFNGLADRLMNFIQMADRTDNPASRLRMAKAMGILPSFTDTLNALVRKAPQGVPDDFLGLLRKKQWRSVVRRLYGLHAKAKAILDQPAEPDAA